VIGATAPWRPGVAVGHNDAVAWAFAPAKLDTQDVFVERINPSNDRQVAAPGGGWRDMTGVMESVPVKGRTEPYEYEKQYTPHGVVIARDRERHLAYALRWSGAEPGGAAELGALAIGRARSWPEFRQALARWRMPVAEFVYADASGRVASQTAGLVPVRAAGRGSLPAAGWTRDAEWRGWLPLDRLPHAIDPRDALIAAAPGSRARAERVIERHTGRAATLDEVRATGRDVAAWNAGQLIPLLATLHAPDPVVEAARQRLLGWDRQVTAESADALLYVIWEHALLRRLAATRVPSVLLDDFVVRSEPILVPSVTAPSAPWFTGDAARQRDALLLDALAAAVDDERRWTGADASATWGRFQAVTFRHPLAITARAARRYNAGPFAVPGYSETMFATERVTAERSMGPVFQIALDVAAWDRSRATLAPGQSAAPDSPHFGDLLPGWLDGTGYPLLFSDAAVADATEAQLTLVPPAAGR
jgi:penicillin amidase